MMKNPNKKSVALALLAVTALAGAGYALYTMGIERGAAQAPGQGSTAAAPPADPALDLSSIAAGELATKRHIKDGIKAGDIDPANQQKIIYYHDPMVPGKRFDAPAKSPFMDMMLVPVYSGGSGSDGSNVTVSPRVSQNLGLRTAEVLQGTLSPQLQAIGNIAWNERDQSVVQARATGFIEKLYVRATLDAVRAGQPFAELYVPEWVAAQQEFLAIKKAAGNDTELVAAARQRMLLLGMTETQAAQVGSSGIAQARTTLTVPSSGVVAELVARVGMTVAPGMMLARINGLASVWALAEVPESQIALLRLGSQVQARAPGALGTVFKGTVQAILPEVAPATRTLKVRVQLANPGQVLSPGMAVTMQFMDQRSTPALLVPTEAIIATGARNVVMLAEDGGRFRPVNVETGIESGGQTEIKAGLLAGQRVVVSSQFLIDSEASLKGVEARLNNEAPVASAANKHAGEGKVEAIGAGQISLSHGPIESAGMKTMTSPFQLPTDGVPRNVAVGDTVQFDFVLVDKNNPKIVRIVPVAKVFNAPATINIEAASRSGAAR
ncbi:MAG: efflux RND transporter periplasmic adaptor subunit [Burkholderiaceae bacterium]